MSDTITQERQSDVPPIAAGPSAGDVPHVYEAIAKVSADLAGVGIGKDKTNQQQGFKYRSIDQVFQVLCTLLPKHGLVIIPRVIYRGVVERATKDGRGTIFNVVVEVEYDCVSMVDGSRHTARIVGEAMDNADKATNKAMAVAYKYLAFLLFCIPLAGVLDDPDADSHDVGAPKQDAKQDAKPAPAKREVRKADPAPAQAEQAAPPAGPPAVSQVPPPKMDESQGVDLPHAAATTLDKHRDTLSIAPSETALRKAFADAYTWASEIADAKARTYVLQQITMEKDTRKATLAAGAA